MILKPDQPRIDQAIAADPHIQRIDALIEKHLAAERARITELKARIKLKWDAIREVRQERDKLAAKVKIETANTRQMEKRTAINRRPIRKLKRRRTVRIQVVLEQVEQQYLKEQRLAFRQAYNLH